MTGYQTHIEKKSLENRYFREILFTGPHSQLVVIALLFYIGGWLSGNTQLQYVTGSAV